VALGKTKIIIITMIGSCCVNLIISRFFDLLTSIDFSVS